MALMVELRSDETLRVVVVEDCYDETDKEANYFTEAAHIRHSIKEGIIDALYDLHVRIDFDV